MYIERGWCSIYVLVDEEEFDSGKIRIVGYFTLSHKALMPETASKESIKKTSGFKDSETIHFVLIGQLGKYMSLDTESGEVISAKITGEEILGHAMEVIRASNSLIPCRCALVECSSNEKVQQFYCNNGFRFFQVDDKHYQFYKRII